MGVRRLADDDFHCNTGARYNYAIREIPFQLVFGILFSPRTLPLWRPSPARHLRKPALRFTDQHPPQRTRHQHGSP